jgi:adenylate cyclase class IV
MNHAILNKESLGEFWKIEVRLNPANDSEATSEVVDNYLYFGLTELGNYSVVELLGQQGNIYTLRVFISPY